jgi:soluble lytic murein transglycosylase-like protein
MAMPPRIHPESGDGAALPQPLAPSDAARIRRIFALQAEARLADAARETALLNDSLLTGPILADRYLNPAYGANASELALWLERYAGQPDAAAIHRKLVASLPPKTPAPPPPAVMDVAIGILRRDVPSPVRPSVLARAARDRFVHNNDADALRLALKPRRGAAEAHPDGQLLFVGGLAAWRLGQTDQAARLFIAAASLPLDAPEPAPPGAPAFWAARAAAREGNAAEARRWLARAADQDPFGFYGQIAARLLGWNGALPGVLGEADVAAIAELPGANRAFALLQVGQTARAAAEFRQLWPAVKQSRDLRRALYLVVKQAGLAALAEEMAPSVAPQANGLRMPKLAPRGGFKVDESLVEALVRIESNFDPAAVSSEGARGLMQLMPVTAGYVSRNPSLAAGARRSLHDPAINLDIGQRYLQYLARQDGVDSNLLRLLASYNAGPASLARWLPAMKDGNDPLIFVEAIPVTETRYFIQRVLAYTWLYAARLDQPAPGLDAIAAAQFPRFNMDDTASAAEFATNTSMRLH